ncbi:phosphoheptose isomerase [Candidatus Williamhamiltonella defendens]|uniref:Phosphoheptose isomerase n=1 Tax=Candidatus Williamhamiltonella defendens TaxID=138072 RepID=A0A2D3T112_9ENTR|nr:SIS domain-containing protein [Candidatus Hamiltonella defensa]ASV33536.1 phosphoheptose isomerase [Candidatus Hamiltonella defensa]ATW29495.1 phosphoheptose isomerase [Candidatus Hamiltonella defensa]ATW31478.1 phosphoheptose isomerase [Candidatus Hamiltonella defensa]ATW33476.1 phosphoheptose isomerase [Candidatus Hamiltonella defensa]AWK16488.1 phosphoheptose isomerase [Candidatus Hamiltonella defensa]
MLDRIKHYFTESIQTQIAAAEALPQSLCYAVTLLVQALTNGNKILCCGNGSSAANAQRFVTNMIDRFETERPSLPAITLSSDNILLTAMNYEHLHYEIYARQVQALGQSGDIFFAISTRGNHPAIIKGVEAALTRNMQIIALTGDDGDELQGLLGENDVEIRVPSSRSVGVEQVHMVVVNCLCDLIDHILFLQQDHEWEKK